LANPLHTAEGILTRGEGLAKGEVAENKKAKKRKREKEGPLRVSCETPNGETRKPRDGEWLPWGVGRR